MSILVIGDHQSGEIIGAVANTVAAAKQIGGDIDVLIAGEGIEKIAEVAAKLEGVTKVLVADKASYKDQLAENVAELIKEIAGNYTHILAPATSNGKNYLPRVAALLDVNMVSEIVEVSAPDTFKRPIYAGNATATVKTEDTIKVLTVRGTAFDPVAESGSASIENIDVDKNLGLSSFVKEEVSKSDRPELTAAKIVVSGGRGVGSKENFDLIFKLGDKLGAAVGASRAAVDAGYVPNDMQVGQTGKVVAPQLYIAIGISGAIQHLAGMKDSKVIVAINKDEEAPIFQVADYGLVADLFEAVPELEGKI